ncbi:MAG: PHP domain-containing protein, partial [Verrucomicrobia bacterium]|nr:PHP domain-containing protein [Deltaproteobacteria bacterium]
MKNDNRYFIDLHIHSNYSDGAFSPEELVQRAVEVELVAIAIADHDSVAGVREGISAGTLSNIDVIPAVELSVQFKSWQDVHLLGYGMDVTDHMFLNKLNGFRERREHRNIEILERVNDMLAEENRAAIDLSEVLVFARDAIGRPHIARALLERGYVSNIEDAFKRYLVPCNVPKCYWPIDDAIKEISRIGGIAVLAHPTTVSTDRQELRDMIGELSEMGLDGIEVFNNMAQQDEMEF